MRPLFAAILATFTCVPTALAQDRGAQRVAGIQGAGEAYGPTLAADGTLCFTTRQVRDQRETITCAPAAPNGWGPSAAAPFSGTGFDKEPYFSPDGRRLFFASRRTFDGAPANPEFDLWVVERTPSGWGSPRRLGDAVNTAAYENYPAVTANGTLYFARRNDATRNDLYRAEFTGGNYARAERLPDGINTARTDADPFIAPDESYIIFSSDRPGGAGQGDLYFARRQGNRWSTPRSLGPAVNTGDYEYTPFISPDGQWLYFSRGWGEIWRIRVAELDMS